MNLRPPPADIAASAHPLRRVSDHVNVERILAGGGEMGALMRALDWGKTPLGPVATWPQSLRTAVSILLDSRYPMFVFWGPQLIKIYNDAYRPITGAKHPWALGKPGPEVWPEIWAAIGPLVDAVIQRGEATWSDDLMLFMQRNGFPEEVYFTFSYSPIRDESGGVAGMFCACTETTGKVIGERRLRILHDLATARTASLSVSETCRVSSEVLGANSKEIPFSLLYLRQGDDDAATLAATSGLDASSDAWPSLITRNDDATARGVLRVLESGAPELISDLSQFLRGTSVGPWPELPTRAHVMPILARDRAQPLGALVLGASSRRPFDSDYEVFFGLVTSQISASLESARAIEDERRRTEALAQLDKAKTAFFSNVSHEFRTPLTLMLGPTEDLLRGIHGELPNAQRAQLELIHRSELRLQRLVNALLDFSRIEAGRSDPRFERVDLAALTRNLASAFRSAIQRAGIHFLVDCSSPDAPVYVDTSMWERIVLNLLSNAFKFTLEGSIELSLQPRGKHAELRVRDTGSGIAEEQLPRIFERFHRVEGARARTNEGSGIGLALVKELVRIHGGRIEVESVLGAGTTFRITVPTGSDHLTRAHVVAPESQSATSPGTALFVEEALRWLPEGATANARSRTEPPPSRPSSLGQPSVAAEASANTPYLLVVDDNADMRQYLCSILASQFRVEAVTNGRAALAASLAEKPDLILTDVMMPMLDGFELLRALRSDPTTRSIPVIMLSARSGDDARIEGLEAGADDYLTKPFSARELLARVSTHLDLSRLRREAESDRARLDELLTRAPVAMSVMSGPDLVFTLANRRYVEMMGRSVVGKSVREAFPELAPGEPVLKMLQHVYATGEAYTANEYRIALDWNGTGSLRDTYFSFTCQPLIGADGQVTDIVTVAIDITAQIRARRELSESELRFRAIFNMAAVSLCEVDFAALQSELAALQSAHGSGLFAHLEARPELIAGLVRSIVVRDVNPATLRMFAADTTEQLLARLEHIVLPEARNVFLDQLMALAAGHRVFSAETALQTLRGERLDVALTVAFPAPDASYERVLITLTDISAQKIAVREREARLAEIERALEFSQMSVGILGHDLRNPLSAISMAAQLLDTRPESERVQKLVRRIGNSAGRMERMITQLLDVTLIRLGRGIPLDRSEVDLAEVARAIVDEVPPQQKERFELTVVGNVVGNWDRDRLFQLLSNLVGNALHHGSPEAPIAVRLDGSNMDTVYLTVRNGGSMQTELIPVVFDSLHGAEHRRVRRDGSSGLGLGLYITRQIALAHSGAIHVESTHGQTTFSVDLPRRALERAESLVFSTREN